LWYALVGALSPAEGGHHVPELGLGLFNETVHAVADIEEDSSLYLAGSRFGVEVLRNLRFLKN